MNGSHLANKFVLIQQEQLARVYVSGWEAKNRCFASAAICVFISQWFFFHCCLFTRDLCSFFIGSRLMGRLHIRQFWPGKQLVLRISSLFRNILFMTTYCDKFSNSCWKPYNKPARQRKQKSSSTVLFTISATQSDENHWTKKKQQEKKTLQAKAFSHR